MLHIEHISDNKLRHIRGVAERCVELGELLDLDDDTLEELYVLGFLHDVGYAFGAKGHAKKGEKILKRLHLIGAEHIGRHGDAELDASEASLPTISDIIKAADLTVDAKGNFVSADERLIDIKDRYGESSSQYKNAASAVSALREKHIL